MNILLVNDDGINSPGLAVLEEELVSHSHNVWVCAPSEQRSACSHAVSLRKKLKVQKVSERHYACYGFPADCVLFALYGAVPMERPDVIISGINNGYNISTDLIYSGTAGAACEGASRGFKAIAVSAERETEENTCSSYRIAASFVADNLEDFVKICPSQCYININVPHEASSKKWAVSTLNEMDYGDYLKLHDEEVFSIEGYSVSKSKHNDIRTDYDSVVNKGIIAVSCIKVLPSVDEKGQEELLQLSLRNKSKHSF